MTEGRADFRFPPTLAVLLMLWSVCWTTCWAQGNTDPCQYFPNGTQIRDPVDCSRGLTCIDFKSVSTKNCSGTTPFYDKDKNSCVKALTDKSTCQISCANATGTFVADPKSCDGYYYCQDEEWARYGQCPGGTHFEFKSQSCIYSSGSNCGMTDLNFCAIVKDDVQFNDPSKCENYYHCKKGKLTSASCKNQYFDAFEGKCVAKSRVPCYHRDDVCGTQKAPKKDTFVSDGATCRGAFYCKAVEGGFDTNPSWVQCPENTFFNEKTQSCADPLTVSCSADRCEGRNLTFVSSGTFGCRHYLRCANGFTVEELDCRNYFFDEVAGVCTSTIISYPSCS